MGYVSDFANGVKGRVEALLEIVEKMPDGTEGRAAILKKLRNFATAVSLFRQRTFYVSPEETGIEREMNVAPSPFANMKTGRRNFHVCERHTELESGDRVQFWCLDDGQDTGFWCLVRVTYVADVSESIPGIEGAKGFGFEFVDAGYDENRDANPIPF